MLTGLLQLQLGVEMPLRLERRRVASQESFRADIPSPPPTALRQRRRGLSSAMANSIPVSSSSFDTQSSSSFSFSDLHDSSPLLPASSQDRKLSMSAATHNKSGLHLPPASSSDASIPSSLPLTAIMPTSASISSSSTGRNRALSKSQLSQASTSPSVEHRERRFINTDLVDIYDRKHHQMPSAPYPLYYESIVTDLDHWDHVYLRNMKKSVSFVDFLDRGPPKKCLDLGCGTGVWVIDAAKEWPDCEFYGYDLAPIQPPTEFLGEIGTRTHWSQGNFLIHRLPYAPETFDFVHIRFVARGVPESGWADVFKEVQRVLTPNGVIELVEEDIIFPKIFIPKDPLEVNESGKSMLYEEDDDDRLGEADLDLRDGENNIFRDFKEFKEFKDFKDLRDFKLPEEPKIIIKEKIETPSSAKTVKPPHAHSLLEWLHNRLYDNQFISRCPTSTLSYCFNLYFCRVTCPPAINFPLPSPPTEDWLPKKLPVKMLSGPLSAEESRHTGESLFPDSNTPFPAIPLRDRSKSLNNAMTSFDRSPNTPSGPSLLDDETGVGVGVGAGATTAKRPHANTEPPPPKLGRKPYLTMSATMVSRTQSNSMSSGPEMFPLGELEDPNLSMHMHRALHNILAAREGMWRCLLDAIENGESAQLERLGWDNVPGQKEEEEALRERFEQRIERFTQEMNTRCALGQAISNSLNWTIPFRDPPTKKERLRMELREEEKASGSGNSSDSEKSERESELESPASRSIRVFIGYKPTKDEVQDL